MYIDCLLFFSSCVPVPQPYPQPFPVPVPQPCPVPVPVPGPTQVSYSIIYNAPRCMLRDHDKLSKTKYFSQ
jgi:hypothetical protein